MPKNSFIDLSDTLDAGIEKILNESIKNALGKPGNGSYTYSYQKKRVSSANMQRLSSIYQNMSVNSLSDLMDDIDSASLKMQIDSYRESLAFINSSEAAKLNDAIKNSVSKLASSKIHSILSNKKEPPISESDKGILKAKLKAEVGQKFTLGQYLCLRTKSRSGSKRVDRIYQVKQIVWCIDDVIIKALVVKQLTGPNYNICSMSQHDCKRVHVKYEPGLQVLSMELPWIPVNPNRVPVVNKTKKPIKKKD